MEAQGVESEQFASKVLILNSVFFALLDEDSLTLAFLLQVMKSNPRTLQPDKAAVAKA